MTYFTCSLWRPVKFAVSLRSGTKISPSTPGSSRFPMSRLWGRGWDLSSDFPEVFEFPTIYDCLSSHHFSIFERRSSTQPEGEPCPFLIWNRIRAYWKSREAQSLRTPKGIPSPRGNYKQKSFTWLCFYSIYFCSQTEPVMTCLANESQHFC